MERIAIKFNSFELDKLLGYWVNKTNNRLYDLAAFAEMRRIIFFWEYKNNFFLSDFIFLKTQQNFSVSELIHEKIFKTTEIIEKSRIKINECEVRSGFNYLNQVKIFLRYFGLNLPQSNLWWIIIERVLTGFIQHGRPLKLHQEKSKLSFWKNCVSSYDL